jgi:signal transduction histidine kinase/CheY-like chemotaxis protein
MTISKGSQSHYGKIDMKEFIDNRDASFFEILNQSSDFYGIASMDGKAVFVNDAGMSMLDLSAGQVDCTKMSDYLGKDLDLFENVFVANALNSKNSKYSGEIHLRNFKTKKEILVWMNFFVFRDQDNKPAYFMAFAKNLEKEKGQHLHLLRQNKFMEALLNSLEDGVLVIDHQSRSVSSANERFFEMWRIPEQLKLEKNDQKLIEHVLSQLKTPEIFVHKLEQLYLNPHEKSYDTLEFIDGRYFERSSFPVLDGEEATSRIWIFRDITDKKNLQERQLAELNNLLDATPSCLKIISRTGELISMNPRGLELIEADSFKDVSMANVYDIVAPEYREAFIRFNEDVCRGKRESLIFEIIGLKGTRRWMESYAAPYKLESGEYGHIAITNDITAKVKEQLKFEKQRSVSAHQTKLVSLGELSAGVGHEINNPLTIIKGYLYSVKEKMKQFDEYQSTTIDSDLEKIELASDRIGKIVTGLRNFSRSDVNEYSQFEIGLAISESIDLIEEIYSKVGVNIDFCNEMDESLEVVLNRGKLQQVVLNLLSNAKDALENRRLKQIKVELRKSKDKIELSVSDTGFGISKAILEKIYDPFFTTKDVNKGTGIGLSLVHSFVTEMGGQIEVKSIEGKGSDFTLFLPINSHLLQHQVLDKQSIEDQWRVNEMKLEGAVLIVDDEPDIRSILREILEKHVPCIFEASNVEEALKLYVKEQKKIKFVFTDIQMPSSDGVELLKKIRLLDNEKKTSIFGFTGGVNIDFTSIDHHFDDYFYKPFNKKVILELVEKSILNKNKKSVA